MTACDFIYDGEYLSSYGLMLCNFDSGDSLDTVTAGSEITLNTVAAGDGRKHSLISAKYDSCYEATFQVCKIHDDVTLQEDAVISERDARSIMRWLNRKTFLKFKLIDEEWDDLYVEASFNLSRIEMSGRLYGFELHMVTNRPFAQMEPRTKTLTFTDKNYQKSQTIIDESDEVGYVYPSHMKIVCSKSGLIRVTNAMENRVMQFANCAAGEIITLDCQNRIIESSVQSHAIYDDFNYSFFRLANTYSDRANAITVNAPCVIEITYEPVAKVVF